VSGGGISTTQINEKTMESKLVAGLFFAGEVIDIVGRRGGYNFNFAWASGMLAGKAMA
jgi:predicted flavoprotein YhiN